MVSCFALCSSAMSTVIGTLRPNYFIQEIQEAYKKRKEKHDIKTE